MAAITGRSDIYVEGVLAHDIWHVYERCWPWLEKALALVPDSPRKHTKQTLRKALEEQRSQLWIAWDNDKTEFIGAAQTEITTPDEWPDATCLEIPLLSGERFPEWGFKLFDILTRWGAAHGCTHMVGYGRLGWIRLFKFRKFGHAPDGVLILVKGLRDN